MVLLADKITDYLISRGVIAGEDYSIYHYGFQTGIELFICLFAGTIIACILNIFFEFIVVLSVLLPLRAYICGIHMKSFISCFFCSVVLVTCGPLLARNIMLSKLCIILVCIGIAVVLDRLAFITTKYQSDSEEVVFFARQRKRILVCILLILVLFSIFDAKGLMKQVLYALVVALVSVMAELVLIKQKDTPEISNPD